MKKYIILFVLLSIQVVAFSQQKKKNLNESVYDSWENVGIKVISNNGKWVAFEAKPYRGNSKLHVYDARNSFHKVFDRGQKPEFASNSKFLCFRVKPDFDTIRKLKIEKVDKKEFPKDSLYIYVLENNKLIKKERLKSVKLPQDAENTWIAFMQYNPKDTTQKKHKTKKKDKNAPKSYVLTIMNPINGKMFTFENISAYSFSRDGKRVAFVKLRNDSILKSSLFVFSTETLKTDSLFSIKGLIKKPVLANYTDRMAFIASEDTLKNKVYSLYYIDNNRRIKLIVDTNTTSLPENWTVSEYGDIFFSRNDQKLFFGTNIKPEHEAEDTIPEDEKPVVDVWSWTDSIIQPMQLANLDKDLKKTYLTLYRIGEDKIIKLQDEYITDISIPDHYNSDIALGESAIPYLKYMSWDYPFYNDYYIINLKNGKREKIITKISHAEISPSSKFVVWYDHADSCWHTYDIDKQKINNITADIHDIFYDDENDEPIPAGSFYYAGFDKNDQKVFIYSKYDIWMIDPANVSKPVRLTNGRENNVVFRYLNTNSDMEYIDTDNALLIRGFDKITKKSGYYSVSVKKPGNVKALLSSDHQYSRPVKAKKANILMWQRESIKNFPDIWVSDIKFKKIHKLSNLNPQQNDYVWATVELVRWTTPSGKQEEGLLYKPENFDPNKKYPMIVYYYELYSDRLHRHIYPRPSRSVINPTFYASNGYLVFIPNIRYKVGHPGKSAVEYVVSGTKSLLKKYPWIDEKHIGLQGQSWGGYQTAYIITQTDMFAAAEAGAPVSNMTSAYGGIRWQSGMSRMFQYERTQSRIGATLWERRDLYIENSPVFFADKVETPLLIMHNDKDGAVPWYQGIEYFVALRRLNKPVWLLNYNGQPHNLKKGPDNKDLSKRMMQFFDHYLKDKPMPVWMKYGIRAVDKGKKLGYELTE